MLAIPSSAVRRLAVHFDPKTLERALQYARDGRVKVRSGDSWPVLAHVRGTHTYSVVVDVMPWTDEIDDRCSCPVGYRCKHAAAALLTAFAREEALERADERRERESDVAEWLCGLSPRVNRREPPPRAIGYVLAPTPSGVEVTIMQAAVLKRGGYGRASIVRLAGPTDRPPHWTPPDDLRRIALVGCSPEWGSTPESSRVDHLANEVLRDLADSGRLFWKTFGASLRYGERRSDVLAWRPAAGDLYRLGLASDRVLVSAQQPHYLDVERGELGPLDIGVGARLLSELTAGPLVPASMLATVERSLQPLLDAESADALRASARVARHQPDTTQSLRFEVELGLNPEGFEEPVWAHGWAVYGDRRFELGSWQDGDAYPRDLLVEGYHAQRLGDLLDEVPGMNEGALGQIAAARHVADVVVPALRDAGWQVELDDDFPFEPPAAAEAWIENLQPLDDSPDWFRLELGVVVAGQTVSLLPILLEAIRKGELPLSASADTGELRPLLLTIPGGEVVSIPTSRLRRWLRPLIELQLRGLRDGGDLVVPVVSALDMEAEVPGRFSDGRALDDARDRMAQLIGSPEKKERKTFSGQLRPYQRRGLAWLSHLHDCGFGGLLADDMGLGKTVQVLAFLEDLRARRKLTLDRPALVVAPRSVVGNWKREAERFAGKLSAQAHLGSGRASRASELAPSHLVVTSYQTLLRDLQMFRDIEWTTIVFDEAQALKNPATQLRRGAAKLAAQSRFCVTGTPVENHLTELWSQIDLGMPGLLGSRPTFNAVFRRPIEKHGDDERLELLRRRIRPFLLRRRKSEVELELPPKSEFVERVALEQDQRDLYESLRLTLDERVRKELKRKGIAGSSILILDALLKLRQCCCDPRLVKVTEARKVKTSAKLERLIAMLEELVDADRRTLVFSQFTSMLDLIARECEAASIPTVMLTGQTSDRERVVDAFQSGSVPVFLISLKAGGTGLNLTRADTVIHYDPWWNPAAEDQATDRAHRIGQEKPVIVYKLVAAGTLEERICALQEDKRRLTGAALHQAGLTHLSEEDLKALFRPIV